MADELFNKYVANPKMNQWLINIQKHTYEEKLFKELDSYYKDNPDKFQIMKNIITGNHEWTIWNIWKIINDDPYLIKWQECKLKEYVSKQCWNKPYGSKQYFDIHKRGPEEYFDEFHTIVKLDPRIDYNGLSTTLGQLNFFRWMFVDDIFDL